MNRLEKIIEHLKAKGAQHIGDAGDKIVTDHFTEYIFRNLTRSVRLRAWNHGLMEVLIIATEICPGTDTQKWESMPPMHDVLRWIDEATKALPKTVEDRAA